MFGRTELFFLSCITLTFFSYGGAVLQEISTQRQRDSASLKQKFASFSPPMTLNSLAGLAQLGQRSTFRFLNGVVRKSAKGIRRVRLIQTYAGYDVFGTAAEAEMDANENLSGQMYGEVVKNLHKSIANPEACQRQVKRLQNIAIRRERLRPDDPNIHERDGRRIVYAGPEVAKARLAYRIEFFYVGAQRIARPVYFFDACTGFVLLNYDQVRNMTIHGHSTNTNVGSKKKSHILPKLANKKTNGSVFEGTSCSVDAAGEGGNLKMGKITYNETPYCLNVQKFSNICRMVGTYSRVVDNEESTTIDKQTPVTFPCSSGYSDPVNGAYGVANDALYFGETAGRFFEVKYGMRALSHTPRLVVHFGKSFQNALWDGRDMYFGDGEDIAHPMVDINVVAHELSHGVTTFNSNLVYRGMSGGINEAFSDITGEVTEYFSKGSMDWLVGADVIKASSGWEALRFFRDPTDDGRSIKYAFKFRPFMNVHLSSGVFNYAFYNLVRRQKMDVYQAYKCFLDANLNLWKPFTKFFSGACNVMQAAYDNGFNHRKVRRAFFRTGIPLIFCDYAALTSSLFSGETREGILVSASRSPILKVELDQKLTNSTSISVVADDQSKVHMVVGRDNEASKVIVRGDDSVSLSNNHRHVYVLLTSRSSDDISVRLTVS